MLPRKICPEKCVFLVNEHQIYVAIYQISEISFQLVYHKQQRLENLVYE